jgi:hypothetical protein
MTNDNNPIPGGSKEQRQRKQTVWLLRIIAVLAALVALNLAKRYL